MSDPGWDIPGVDRDAAPSAGGLPAGSSPAASSSGAEGAGGGTRPARRRRRAGRDGSVSAAHGLCAGAFAPAGAGNPASASLAAGSPAAGTAGDSSDPQCARAADGSAQPPGHGCGCGQAGTGPGPAGGRAAGGGAGVRPRDAAQALASLSAALEFLAADDPAEWSEGLQADCLRALAVAESRQAAAHARVLAAFSVPGGGLNGDGHRSARVWLSWQTRATRPAAAAKVAWMRRLHAHPQLAAALAAGTLSVSWARQIADWSDRLPEDARGDADTQFLTAAGLGAGLAGLAGLAGDLQRQHAAPDPDDTGGFGDRTVRLDTTFEGAGRLTGDLTPGCAAAVQAVLDSLARPAGPDDDRTAGQRRHDALEEVFRRLIASGTLPQRAGQPVRLELGITLAELLAGDPDGNTCDAVIHPVITGHVDYNLLHQLTHPGTSQDEQPPLDTSTGTSHHRGSHQNTDSNNPDDSTGGNTHSDSTSGRDNTGENGASDSTGDRADGITGIHGSNSDGDGTSGRGDNDSDAAGAAGAPGREDYGLLAGLSVAPAGPQDVLAAAIRLLSGPAGVAMALRRAATGIPLTSVSLPLYMATGFDTIPAHLRRAVRSRDGHCRFPGCDVPAAACDVHHVLWRSRGGRHLLTNLVLLCHFHHHIAIHRQGWAFTLHADGSTTATSPDQTRTLHDHPPPRYAA